MLGLNKGNMFIDKENYVIRRFIISLSCPILLMLFIMDYEIEWHVEHMQKTVIWENFQVGDVGVDNRIILKWDLEK